MKISTLFYNKKRFLFYLLIISITPGIIYGVFQGSNSIAVNQLNELHEKIESDFEVQMGDTSYVFDYVGLQARYDARESLNGKITIIMAGLVEVMIENVPFTIYFCEFDDFFSTPRYFERFPELSNINRDNISKYSVYMNDNAITALNVSVSQNLSLSGYSAIGNRSITLNDLNLKDEFNPTQVLREKTYYGTWNVKKTFDYGSLFSLEETSFIAENFILMDIQLIEDQAKLQLGSFYPKFIKMNILYKPLQEFSNFQEWRRDLVEAQDVFETFLIPKINANKIIIQRYYLLRNFQIIENGMQIFKMFTILTFLPILIFTWIISSSMDNSALNNELMNLRLEYIRGWSKKRIFGRIYLENLLINITSLPVMIILGEFIKSMMEQTYTANNIENLNLASFILGILDYFDKIFIIIGINLVISWLLLYFNLRKVDIIFQKDFSFKDFHELPVNIHQKISLTNRNPLLKVILVTISIIIPVSFILFRTSLQASLSSMNVVFSALEVITIILLLFNPIAIVFLFANDISQGIFKILKKSVQKIKSTDVHFHSFINFRNNKVQLFAIIFMVSMVMSHFIMSDNLYKDVEQRNLEHAFNVNGAEARIEIRSGLSGGYDPQITESLSALAENHNSSILEIVEDFSYFFHKILEPGQNAIYDKRIQLNLFNSRSYLAHLAENQDKIQNFDTLVSIFEPMGGTNQTIISSYFKNNYGLNVGDHILIRNGDLNYSLRIAGVYEREDPPIPGIMLDSASTIFMDSRHVLMQNTSNMDYKLSKQIYLFPNITDSMHNEIENGFNESEETVLNQITFEYTTLEDIELNLRNPVFDFALYPVLIKFIRLESIFVLIFLGIGILSFINNIFYQNIDSLLLNQVRGKDPKIIYRFILKLSSFIFSIVFLLSFLGYYNGFLIFEIFSKSEISMSYNPLVKGLGVTWSNFLLGLLLFGALFIAFNAISFFFYRLYTKNPQKKLKWLKRE